MALTGNNTGRIEAALGTMMADGCFCLAFTMHLLSSNSPLAVADYFGMGIIACVFAIACYVIYDEHWLVQETSSRTSIIKKLRITELNEGAAIEFDGQRYRVDNINRATGEILIERIGKPGCIIVQIHDEE